MWPFNKKTSKAEKKEEIENNVANERKLVAVRYTYDVWENLFPEMTKEEWEEANCPNDIAHFLKQSIAQHAVLGEMHFTDALIATLDDVYLDWLCANDKRHSQFTLKTYLQKHMEQDDFWDERLQKSEMTATYNVMCIPIAMILHDLNGLSSEYVLTKETANKLADYFKTICNNDMVYVPGWISKEANATSLIRDIIQLANSYWNDGTRVRYGKYLEQNYTKEDVEDLFSPFRFVIPFVVKTDVMKAKIDFKNTESKTTNCLQPISALKLTKTNQVELMEILVKDYPQIVAIGNSAITPEQAYLSYVSSAQKRQDNSSTTKN